MGLADSTPADAISVIIPTYNEQDYIGPLILHLQQEHITEIIVVDGGSSDETVRRAQTGGALVVPSKLKSRALQMNLGASHATREVLYFLHADTIPPPGFASTILAELQSQTVAGCFRLKFDQSHWFLKFNCWFTRFNVNAFRFGDQSLFVRRSDFNQISGFDSKRILLEDQEIITRLQKLGPFIVLPQAVTTSARSYQANGVFRLQVIYYLLYTLHRLGVSQGFLWRKYRQWIKSPKT